MRAQARTNRRLRVVLTGAVLLLVVAMVAGGIAFVQSDRASESAARADENAAQAERSAISALARGAAARGTASGDLDSALLLAAAGVVLEESPETVGNLQQVISQNPALIRSTPLTGNETMALDVYPDGKTAALLDTAYSLSLVDLTSGAELARRQIGRTRTEIERAEGLRVSPDGRLLAVAAAPYSDRLLHLLDATTLQPLDPQPPGVPKGAGRMMHAEFSQDGSTLVAVVGRLARDGDRRDPVGTQAYVWALGSTAEPLVVDLSRWTERWASAALSPDGRLLYTATPTVRVHDLRTGAVRILSVQGATQDEVVLEASPDGRLLVLARVDLAHDAILIDADTGRVRHTLRHDIMTSEARFSSDGRRVLTVTIRPIGVAVWDTRTGRRIAQIDIPAATPVPWTLPASGDRVISSTWTRACVTGTSTAAAATCVESRRRECPGIVDGTGTCVAAPSADGAYVAYTVCDRWAGSCWTCPDAEAHPQHTPGRGYSWGGWQLVLPTRGVPACGGWHGLRLGRPHGAGAGRPPPGR